VGVGGGEPADAFPTVINTPVSDSDFYDRQLAVSKVQALHVERHTKSFVMTNFVVDIAGREADV
jgi:hypothetical protein